MISETQRNELLSILSEPHRLKRNEPMRFHTTLRTGGPAELFYRVHHLNEFANIAIWAQQHQVPHFILGHGSNILVSDDGIEGLVLFNSCETVRAGELTYAETGVSFRDLFLKTAQAHLSGLQFAVGIPGTLGGALISNAGAYRHNIADLLVSLDIVTGGERKTVSPDWMQFSYRDSRLRQPNPPPTALLAVEMKLQRGDWREVYAFARDIQRQRISKQPPQPSVGSFFKNIYNPELAAQLPQIPEPIRAAGVVPAGYLIAACGLKGIQIGGAQVARKHANFLINLNHATASDLYLLAQHVKRVVFEQFGVTLEEEALYVGNWRWDE